MKGTYRGVVLLTIDSLRADHMSAYGYGRDTTPFLDEFSRKNIIFTDAVSAGPTTSKTFPSLLSSTYPSTYHDPDTYDKHLSEDRKIISEVLPDDVSSAAFHSNPFISSYYGYDRGFDRFEDFLITDQTINAGSLRKVKRLGEIILGKPPFTSGEEINRRSLEWIRNTEGRFFLWNHYMEPHMPYLPPKRYLKELGISAPNHIKKMLLNRDLDRNNGENLNEEEVQALIALYDCCIRHMDDILKEMITSLQEDVAVIITADHGEGFREHGFMSHTGYLYDEIVHVPLIVSGKPEDVSELFSTIPNIDGKSSDFPVELASKGIWKGGRLSSKPKTDTRPVGHVDIASTVLSMYGEDIPEFYQGRDLRSDFDSSHSITEFPSKNKWIISLRGKGWKYIQDNKRNREEFYDLEKDPGEKKNLTDKVDLSQYRKAVEEHRKKQKSITSHSEKQKISSTLKKIKI